MPRFKITAPDGREITIEGDNAPTQEDAAKIFASLPPPRRRAVDIMGGDSRLDRERQALRSEAGREELKTTGSRGAEGALADIGIQATPAIAGGMIGGVPGAIIGGILGNIGAQSRRILANEQPPEFKIGQIAGAGLSMAMPLAPLAQPTSRLLLAREAVKQGAAGLGAKAIETEIDEGRLPTAGETVATTVIPGAGGALALKLGSKGVDPLSKTERATLEAAKREGYVITPSTVSDSAINRRLESIAGKAAVGQAAAIKNQPVTDRLAKEAIAVPQNVDLTMATLRNVRKQAAIPYEKIEAMSVQAQADLDTLMQSLNAQAGGDPHLLAIMMADPNVKAHMKPLLAQAGADIDALRAARNEATRQFEAYKLTGKPDALDKGIAARELAETLEDKIEIAAQSVGDPDLLTHLREARTRIAKSHDVERALNLGNAEVSAPIIGRALDKGRPLTDELETIGKFAEAFPSVTREASKVPTPGVSKIEAGTAALLATLGVGATHNPAGALVGALPLLSGPTRSLLLSRPYQALLTAEPFAMPKTADATRLLAQAAGQELTEGEKKTTTP